MPLSASKSTSKREISASAAKQQSTVDSRKKNPLQRSKSVNAVTRTYTETPVVSVGGDPSVAQFFNKRDNPLFCCSSPSSPEHEGVGVGCNTRRGRSVSRSLGYGNRTSESRNLSTRSLSRVGSKGRLRAISKREEDGECKGILSLRNETMDSHEPKFQKNKGSASNGYGMLEQRKNLQTWRSQHPVSDYCNTSSSRSWEDGISISSLSELEETTVREHDHPSARDGVGSIYQIVRSEVQWAVSEMKNDLENAIWRKNFTDSIVEGRPENRDPLELFSDIRLEYETMLKESHERARKLRADLAVEEQRGREIDRMLEEIVSDENSAPRKSRPRQKLSTERLEMSRRLAEDAMSYFDECVSISTFDSSEFSSTEDLQPRSVGIIPPLYVSAVGSNLAAISSCSSSQDVNLPLHKLSNLGERIESSSAWEAANSGESLDFGTRIKRFGKEPNRCAENIEVSSSFNINDFDLDYSSAESLLLDTVVFKNRIESGCLLLCDIRTF